RMFEGVGGLIIGGAFVGLGTGLLVDNFSKSPKFGTEGGTGMVMLVGGGTTLLFTPLVFLWPGDIERFSVRTRALASEGQLARMEQMLDAQARKQRTLRYVAGTFCLVAAAVITPIGAASAATNTSLNDDSRTSAGGAIAVIDTILIAEGLRFLIVPSMAEQLQRSWLASTGRPMSIDLAPRFTPNGGGVQATFTF